MFSGLSKSRHRVWVVLAAAFMAAGLFWAWAATRSPGPRRPGRLVQAVPVLAYPMTEGCAWASLK